MIETLTLTDIKLSLLSVATARATIVFEQPGGPNNKIPRGGVIPKRVNESGYFNGHSKTCCNFNFRSS